MAVRRGMPGLALAAIGLGLGAFGLAAANSDQQFARTLEVALAEAPAHLRQLPQTSTQTGSLAPVSGSEAFWLDTPRRETASYRPANWQPRAIVPGDRFQFGGDSENRILEVTEVRQLPTIAPGPTAPEQKAEAALMIVTLRDVASPDAKPVRLLVDQDAPIAGLRPLNSAQHSNL